MENKDKAIEELEKGRDFANQLRFVINGGDHGSASSSSSSSSIATENLVKKVLMSFTNSLLILNNLTTTSHHEVHDAPSSCGITKSEDSQESNCKSSTLKERRGCYKRRRTSQSWEKESETPTDDGHQWRKYGQKVILNAKHPRNYYRCTHKFDQGCQATKQVQKVQDEPTLYKTTYYGQHTCRNLLSPEIILDPSCASSSVLLSFDNTLPTPTNPFLSSSSPSFPSSNSSLVKKECKEEIANNSSSSNDDYWLSSDQLTFDNSRHVTTMSPNLDSDDVISSVFCDTAELDWCLF